MKYALLVHVNKEAVDQPNAKVAGMAYGEALRAAGIFVAGAGLGSPETATWVSVRNGARQVHDILKQWVCRNYKMTQASGLNGDHQQDPT